MNKILILFFFTNSIFAFKNSNSPTSDFTRTVPDQIIKKCMCAQIYLPVCGEDGKTYSNACTADCIKIKYTMGACLKNSKENHDLKLLNN